MIRSMTGFAALSREASGERVAVTVKAVNHRFLDMQIKAPQALAPLDGTLRALIQGRLTRGRVELTIGVEHTVPPPRDVVLDEALLEQVSKAIEGARARGVLSGALTASDVLRIPQAIEIRQRTDPGGTVVETVLAELVLAVVGDALAALVAMRETEGRFLEADLDVRVATLGQFVDELESLAQAGQRSLADRLRERVAELPADLAGDPAMLAQEVVRFVARSDVDEELVRMRGHVRHWEGLARGAEACGRKLDFLLQEMNREINTIGSKIEGARGTEVVIQAKAELERLREQVQNVE
jgi:uncharacterized protein (TIGR00255 family)